jgi:hypothetical protein
MLMEELALWEIVLWVRHCGACERLFALAGVTGEWKYPSPLEVSLALVSISVSVGVPYGLSPPKVRLSRRRRPR